MWANQLFHRYRYDLNSWAVKTISSQNDYGRSCESQTVWVAEVGLQLEYSNPQRDQNKVICHCFTGLFLSPLLGCHNWKPLRWKHQAVKVGSFQPKLPHHHDHQQVPIPRLLTCLHPSFVWPSTRLKRHWKLNFHEFPHVQEENNLTRAPYFVILHSLLLFEVWRVVQLKLGPGAGNGNYLQYVISRWPLR